MRLRRKVAAGAAVAIVTGGAGVAWAAWTSSGSGGGEASTGTSTNSAISVAAAASDMYPGADKTMTVTISNPNPYPVIVTGISGGESAAQGDCVVGSIYSDGEAAATGVVQDDGTTTVIAPEGSGDYVLDVHMINDPSDVCKSATFPLALTATLESAAS